jgi:DNA invertase Pin-like site-specific DNA recombinase
VCEKEGYTLIVSKLDRLGRNVKCLFEIKDRVKDIIIIDQPKIDTLMFGIYATIAQHERETISLRTKDALNARFLKTGLKNGNKKGYDMSKAIRASTKVRKEKAMLLKSNLIAKNITIIELEKGSSYKKIALYLNEIGLKTPRNKLFSTGSVQKVICLYALKKKKKVSK